MRFSLYFSFVPALSAQMVWPVFGSVTCLVLHGKHINTVVAWHFSGSSFPKGYIEQCLHPFVLIIGPSAHHHQYGLPTPRKARQCNILNHLLSRYHSSNPSNTSLDHPIYIFILTWKSFVHFMFMYI